MKKCSDDTIIIAYTHPYFYRYDIFAYAIRNPEIHVYYYDYYCDTPSLVWVCKLSAAKSEVLQELCARK